MPSKASEDLTVWTENRQRTATDVLVLLADPQTSPKQRSIAAPDRALSASGSGVDFGGKASYSSPNAN